MQISRVGRVAAMTSTACRSLGALRQARAELLGTPCTPSKPLLHAQKISLRSFSTDAGSTVVGRCESKIAEALKPTHLRVRGMHDDPNGSHIIVEVVSEAFVGKNAVMRQRMVYKALWEEMSAGGALHAVDGITALTPAEHAAQKTS